MSQQYSGSAEGAPDAATRATTRPVARATRRSATFFALKSDDPRAPGVQARGVQRDPRRCALGRRTAPAKHVYLLTGREPTLPRYASALVRVLVKHPETKSDTSRTFNVNTLSRKRARE